MRIQQAFIGWVSVVVVMSVMPPTRAQAETIVLRSGNGPTGGNDSLIRMLVAPTEGGFGRPLVAEDFAAARNGPNAYIAIPDPSYLQALSGDPDSRWISTALDTSTGDSALFAIEFTIRDCFASAVLDLHFAVDNFLGDPSGGNTCMGGVFVNEFPIPGSIPCRDDGHNYGIESAITGREITRLLMPGINTLYFYMRDGGSASGLIFRARIDTSPPVCCQSGNVNASAGSPSDVLFVNGSAGGAERTVTLGIASPVDVTLLASPSGPAMARYVLWIWNTPPLRQVTLDLGSSVVGCVVNPTPLQPFLSPQPFRAMAIGEPSVFVAGIRVIDSPVSAPWTVTRSQGFAQPRILTLQGIIDDDGATSTDRLSVTNAVVLDVN